MSGTIELDDYLDRWTQGLADRIAIAETVRAVVSACADIQALVARGPLEGAMSTPTGRTSGVDPQKKIDVDANDLIVAALAKAPVAALLSEELEQPLQFTPDAPLAVAVDPIDGSSNTDVNVSIGSIFSILPVVAGNAAASFLQPGQKQVAAGFTVYGPFTALVLTLGNGTQIFTLDPATRRFRRTTIGADIPPVTAEYAINSSNYRHWDESYRIYLDDLMRGREGPRSKDFNMRWTASPVSDLFRILSRGGIFLYPGDVRDGYGQGRLRLIYEANPFAWLIEQAGGCASTGTERVLDVIPCSPHQRTPIIAGSRAEVEYLIRLLGEPHGAGERSPLFNRRGLFRN